VNTSIDYVWSANDACGNHPNNEEKLPRFPWVVASTDLLKDLKRWLWLKGDRKKIANVLLHQYLHQTLVVIILQVLFYFFRETKVFISVFGVVAACG
jgi:hypothetical protein